jgi:hypothetical protein
MHKVIPYFGGYRRFDRVLLGIPRACSAVKECASSTMTAHRRAPIAASHSLARRFSSSLASSRFSVPAACSKLRNTNGEFLQSRDEDLDAVDQRRRQLARVLIDGFDDPLRMLDLIDRILQLLVELAAIGYDNDAVEDLSGHIDACQLGR